MSLKPNNLDIYFKKQTLIPKKKTKIIKLKICVINGKVFLVDLYRSLFSIYKDFGPDRRQISMRNFQLKNLQKKIFFDRQL